jgi:nitroreductase
MADFSQRDPAAGVDALFVERWSPRAFVKADIAASTLASIIDAARWSPSCFNDQPWRFYTSNADTFGAFLDLLVEGNQAWAANAGVLGFITARKQFAHNGEPNGFASFDAGAAWLAMTLQANKVGLHTHGMGGIHRDAAAEYLGLDTDEEQVLMGFAIGTAADVNQLTDEQRQREVPNGRRPLDEIWLKR